MKKLFYKTLFFFLIMLPLKVLAANDDIETVFGLIPRGEEGLKTFIGEVFAWVAGIIGTLSMLGLIYAGYTYITSQGNPDYIGKAKDIMWTSLAALFIIIFSWALFDLLGVFK